MIVFAVVLILAGATRVDTRRPVDPKVKAATAEYQAGKKLFEKGDWDGAIDHYEKAYEADGDPNLLVITAEAYRKKPDCETAIELYRKYLEVAPKAKNRAAIEEIVGKLDKLKDDPFSEGGDNPCAAVPPPSSTKSPAP